MTGALYKHVLLGFVMITCKEDWRLLMLEMLAKLNSYHVSLLTVVALARSKPKFTPFRVCLPCFVLALFRLLSSTPSQTETSCFQAHQISCELTHHPK